MRVANVMSLVLLILAFVKGHIAHEDLFNRKLTGIEFSPFILTDGLVRTPRSFFTTQNVGAMLKVVSKKFARILVRGDDLAGGNVQAHTAEEAAMLNRERNNLTLTVMMGVTDGILETSILDAPLSVARKAQSIYPGTVSGLFIDSVLDISYTSSAEKLLQMIISLRQMSHEVGVPVGFQIDCEHFYTMSHHAYDTDLVAKKSEILRNSDFVICASYPEESGIRDNGILPAFTSLQSRVLRERSVIKKKNRNIEVMWCTSWINRDVLAINDTLVDIKDYRDYWLRVDRFATKQNYIVWLSAAFKYHGWRHSIRSRTISFTYTGWWKLTNYDLINNVSGYMEYVSVLPASEGGSDNSVSTTESPLKIKNETNIVLKTFDKVNGQTSWKRFTIVIGILPVALAIMFAGVIYVMYKKRNQPDIGILTTEEIQAFRLGISKTHSYKIGEADFVNMNMTAFNEPYDRLLEIPKRKFEIKWNRMLGDGEFGCVFKAFIIEGTDYGKEVALKMTKPKSGSLALKGLLSEIKILSYLGHHPNIVPIIGAYTAEIEKGIVYFATELCPLGSLKTFLDNIGDNTNCSDSFRDPFSDMIRWSHEIACGMEYIGQKGVIHADLATRNVLLSIESTAKISDFGLSRRLHEYTNYIKTSQEPLPWRWMAFESLKSMEFSAKSDVWSYGVTMWEIFSLGAQPYPGIGWTTQFLESLEDGVRLAKPRYATPEIFAIMTNCWNMDKETRPSFTDLKCCTKQILTEAADNLYTTLHVC